MPELNQGTDAFTRLVSLRHAGLGQVSVADGRAALGAAATLADLEAAPELGFLAPALQAIASPTIRNMATVAGNLFVKQPYGDLAACLVALDAVATVSDGAGSREPCRWRRWRGRASARGEIVTTIGFALPPRTRSASTRRAARR